MMKIKENEKMKSRFKKGRLAALAFALIAGLFTFTPGTLAAPSGTVSITSVMPNAAPWQLLSGQQHTSTVSYTCGNTDVNGCQNAYVLIPFNASAVYDEEPLVLGESFTFNPVTNILRVELGNLDPGTTGAFDVQYTFSSTLTPNGYSQVLTPTLYADDLVVDSSNSITTNYVANGTIVVDKSVLDPGKAYQGGTYIYTIEACRIDTGIGYMEPLSWTITDVLPMPLQFVDDDTTGWNPATRTLTITHNDIELPLCSLTDETPIRSFEVFVPEATPVNTEITNSFTMNGQWPGNVPFTYGDSHTLYVEEPTIPGGSWNNGFFGAVSPGTTWAGDWRPNVMPSTFSPTTVEQVYNMPSESIFTGEYRVPAGTPHAFNALAINLPCLNNKIGSSYRPIQTLCADPAYHPTTIAFNGVPAALGQNLYIQRTDGSVFTLPWESPGRWKIPDTEIENVAAIRYGFDYTRELTDPFTSGPEAFYAQGYYFSISGHIDESLEPEERVRVSYSSGRAIPGEGASVDYTHNEIAVAKAHITSAKTVQDNGPGDRKWILDSRWASVGEAQGDLVTTDLLPVDTDTSLTSGNKVVNIIRPDGSTGTVNSYVEVIPNWNLTGRTLFRATVTADELNNHSPGTIDTSVRVIYEIPIVLYKPAGNHINTSAVTITDYAMAPACGPSSEGVLTDSTNWDQNSLTTWGCVGSAVLPVDPQPGSAELRLYKSVQGDNDTNFISPPGVGRVELPGGEATYRLTATNFGVANLNNVVVYDIFPHVGDVGVINGTSRGSTFAPELTSVGALPAGVSIQYSQSINPCRPEVLATNPTCVNDWTATAPGDLGNVKAIRLSSTQTYATGNGFSLDLTFETPSTFDADDIAYNIIGGRATNAGTGVNLAPNEASKSGFIMLEPEGLEIFKVSDLEGAPDPTATHNPFGLILDWGAGVTWYYRVENIGPSTITDITVVDSMGVTVECPANTLIGYSSMTCTGTGSLIP